MLDRLNWGVMGNATIARMCVIPAIRKSRNGIVRALASRSPQKAAGVCRRNRIDRLYDNYQALIEDPDIEAIYIPLPNHLHAPWTVKALSAGKHVLCEKPLACNTRQAQTMAAAADAGHRILMEGFMYRFHPRSQKIHRLVSQGAIGVPRLVRSAFCYSMSPQDANAADNPRLDPEMGGGALLDVGCYCTSIARWLYGSEPIQVQCQACFHPRGVDLHTTGMLKFKGDRLATFEASFISALQQTYTAVGEQGVIELPHDAFIPWEKASHYTLREKEAESAEPTIIPGADEYRLMVEHFVDAARGIAPPAFPISDSIGNMRVLDALAAAARSGETVCLYPCRG
jgi:predicted dehydrogenase